MYLTMKKRINLLWSYLVRILLIWLPDIPIIMRFRGWCYSFGMASAGYNFQVASSAELRGLLNINIGNNVYVGPNTYILSRGLISIESDVLIAMNVVIVDCNHGFSLGSFRFTHDNPKPIEIGFGSWIAANTVIVAGTNIGKGCLIGAGSVCSGDYIENTTYVTSKPSIIKRN